MFRLFCTRSGEFYSSAAIINSYRCVIISSSVTLQNTAIIEIYYERKQKTEVGNGSIND